jgi:hypothetical protein
MSKRISYKDTNAPIVIASGDGWMIQYDRFTQDYIANVEHEMDWHAIAFCRTQGEAQTKINQYRFEELDNACAGFGDCAGEDYYTAKAATELPGYQPRKHNNLAATLAYAAAHVGEGWE